MNSSHKTLVDLFYESTQLYAQREALVMRVGYRTHTFTYKQVSIFSLAIANYLRAHDVQQGDRVLVMANNSPYFVCVLWGITLRGAVAVVLNIQNTQDQVERIACETQAKIFFANKRITYDISNVKKQYIELLKEDVDSCLEQKAERMNVLPEDMAQIMYTSGTTGAPKGVVLTHKNMISALHMFDKGVPITKDDRFLSILPLSHIFEQMVGLYLPFGNGAKVVYAHSPSAIASLMKQHKITAMAGVPEFLHVVMTKIEKQARDKFGVKFWRNIIRLGSLLRIRSVQRVIFWPIMKAFGGHLRIVASGGAPLGADLERKWNALGVTLLQGYGMTETSAVISFNTPVFHKLASVGQCPKGLQVKIGEDGEVLVKGSNIFTGYYKNKEKTSEVFTEDGWFHTGDMGSFDKEKFLLLKGRKKYMILGSSGQNIYPEDIEQKINLLDGVKENCVVGYQKDDQPVEVHAIILPERGEDGVVKIDCEEVVKKVNRQLASYQYLGGCSIWNDIDFPRSSTRKIKKNEVEKWLALKKDGKDTGLEGSLEDRSQLEILISEISGVNISNVHADAVLVKDLHLDSLLRIELVTRIEEMYGVMVSEEKITQQTTVCELEELVRTGPKSQQKAEFHEWALSWWASLERANYRELTIFPFMRLVADIHVHGLENLENVSHPVVFMPNHISHYDSVVVAMSLPLELRKRISFAAAEDVIYQDYKAVAPFAEFMFNSFPFPRKQGSRIKAGLEYMGRILDNKWSVVLYPEGELSASEDMLPIKQGAGLIAVEMEVPIVPIRIKGLAEIFPNKSFKPKRRGRVDVFFGKPIKFDRKTSYNDAKVKIEDVLLNLGKKEGM